MSLSRHVRTLLNVELLEDRQVMSAVSGLRPPLVNALFAHARNGDFELPKGLVNALTKTGVAEVILTESVAENVADRLLEQLPDATKERISDLPVAQQTIVIQNLLRTIVTSELREVVNVPTVVTNVPDNLRDNVSETPITRVIPLSEPSTLLDPGEKAKLAITNALMDLAFAPSRSEFISILDAGSFLSKGNFDAGRLAPAPEEEAKADAGQKSSKVSADEFSLLLARQKQTDGAGRLAVFAALGQRFEDDIDFLGMTQAPALAGGLSADGAIDGAIARFFAQLDAFGRDLIGTLTEPGTMLWVIGVGVGMVSMELARRQVKRHKRPSPRHDSTGWAPGLPLPGMN